MGVTRESTGRQTSDYELASLQKSPLRADDEVRTGASLLRRPSPVPTSHGRVARSDFLYVFQPFGQDREVRLIVRRVRPTPGSQLALVAVYDYHAFITNREGGTLYLEADHRRHAVVEDVIRDLPSAEKKYGVGLNHLPSGRFSANAAWLVLNALAHNLGRWVRRLGLGEESPPMTTKTLRTRYLSLPGRMTRSARHNCLHLPVGWPWEAEFNTCLKNLRAIAPFTTPLRV
ncbi:MAG: transposase [Acidimicrobiales bacterium]